jgi:carbonic anhydrase
MSSIDTLLANNAARTDTAERSALPISPAKEVAIVACMDARMTLTSSLGIAQGDAHIIRNAGGIVTDDVIRSISLSQVVLGTREVMIIQHTDCGLQSSTDEEIKDAIELETGSRPPFRIGAFPDLENNLRKSIRRVRESPFVKHKDAVRGFVYDIETGRLREVE